MGSIFSSLLGLSIRSNYDKTVIPSVPNWLLHTSLNAHRLWSKTAKTTLTILAKQARDYSITTWKMYSVGGVGRCDTSVLRTADIYHLLESWMVDRPTGYIRKTALELRSSPSLWFVRLNTWWVFSSHDVLPPLNSVVGSFYVSVRVNFPLAGVCLFCAVTSLTVVFVTCGWKSQELEDALFKGVQSQCF